MTIDEYLNQAKRLKIQADKAKKKFYETEDRATALRSSLNLGDGTPRGRSGRNGTESRFIEAAEAADEYQKAIKAYSAFRHQLRQAIDNLLFWEGSLIQQIYLCNIYWDRKDIFQGVEDILNTNDQRRILAKLDEAKAHLTELLTAQGIEIEK